MRKIFLILLLSIPAIAGNKKPSVCLMPYEEFKKTFDAVEFVENAVRGNERWVLLRFKELGKGLWVIFRNDRLISISTNIGSEPFELAERFSVCE